MVDIISKKKNGYQQLIDFRQCIDEYDTTIYVEEALHRLVEVHYTIGIKSCMKLKKYAKVLRI